MAHQLWHFRIIPILYLGLLLATPAAAAPLPSGGQKPCMEELEKYCRDVRPGEGRIILCLQGHDRELSSICRDKVQSIVRRMEEAKQACTADIVKFCADAKPGGGRLIKCMTPHLEELTPACREKAEPFLKHRAQAKSSTP